MKELDINLIKNNINNFKNIPEILEKSSKIKAIISDVDGVLTDGKLYYSHEGNITKNFSVKDGQLVKFFKQKGFLIGFITGRKDNSAKIRGEHLNIDFYREGSKNKIKDLEDFKTEFNLENEEICYLGDDLIDLEVLNKVGLSICPNDAVEYIKPYCDVVSNIKGGDGVFRLGIDLILISHGLMKDFFKEKGKFWIIKN